MILVTLCVLSLLSTTFLLIGVNGLINEWYDIWIILAIYLGFFIAYLFITLLIIILYGLTLKKDEEVKYSNTLNKVIKRICELILQVSRIKLNIRGIEKLDRNQNYLLIQNHLSNFDPLVTIWALRNFKLSIIHKESLLKLPFVGRALYQDGHISIDRSNNRKGLESILKAIKTVDETDRSVLVYPEGTRSKTETLAEFHNGTFKIAQKSKKPIVVSAIINTESVKRRFYFSNTKVYLDIIDVLKYEDYKDLNTEEISNKVHKMIEDRLNELESIRYKHK